MRREKCAGAGRYGEAFGGRGALSVVGVARGAFDPESATERGAEDGDVDGDDADGCFSDAPFEWRETAVRRL